MKIVTAGQEQLDAVAGLFDAYRQFYRQPSAPERARHYLAERMIQKQSVIFLALHDDGSALGFTQLYPSFCSVSTSAIWILYDLFVSEAARRRGVGRGLMDRAREHAESTGASRIDLSTATGNTPAQALYERLGYVRDSDFFGYSLELGTSPELGRRPGASDAPQTPSGANHG
jgi:ribosomal protein S18 acetylase RimI-like enzyme